MGLFLIIVGVALLVGTFVCDIFNLLPGWYSLLTWVSYILGLVFCAAGAGLQSGKNKKKTLLKLVFMAAAADGDMSEEEVSLLNDICRRNGITNDYIAKCVSELGEGNTSFAMPEDDADKKEILNNVVKMVALDGVISEREKTLVNELASKFGYSEDMVDSLINKYLKK